MYKDIPIATTEEYVKAQTEQKRAIANYYDAKASSTKICTWLLVGATVAAIGTSAIISLTYDGEKNEICNDIINSL